jgi:predicted aldo/keto reductase-like oxidoreductase
MRLPAPGGRKVTILSSIDKERAAKQIRYAIDKGVNYLDTAYPYHAGSSESFLGEHVLKDGYREKVNVATKLACMSINNKEGIEEIFNKQLQNLQVEYIDYYLLHGLTGHSWDKMLSLGIIDFMDKIRKQGKVRHMGFSFHDAKEEFIRIVDGYNWEFAQVQFNILDEYAQAGIEGIKYAHAKGLGIIVMEPLRGGALAGRIPGEAQKIYDNAPVKRSSADWALRWIWNHPEITVVLEEEKFNREVEEVREKKYSRFHFSTTYWPLHRVKRET